MQYCPKTGKKKYASRNAAEITISAIESMPTRDRKEKRRSHYSYFCKHCESFHLTTKPPKPKKKP